MLLYPRSGNGSSQETFPPSGACISELPWIHAGNLTGPDADDTILYFEDDAIIG